MVSSFKTESSRNKHQFLVKMSRAGEYWSDAEEMKILQHLKNGTKKPIKKGALVHKK